MIKLHSELRYVLNTCEAVSKVTSSIYYCIGCTSTCTVVLYLFQNETFVCLEERYSFQIEDQFINRMKVSIKVKVYIIYLSLKSTDGDLYSFQNLGKVYINHFKCGVLHSQCVVIYIKFERMYIQFQHCTAINTRNYRTL